MLLQEPWSRIKLISYARVTQSLSGLGQKYNGSRGTIMTTSLHSEPRLTPDDSAMVTYQRRPLEPSILALFQNLVNPIFHEKRFFLLPLHNLLQNPSYWTQFLNFFVIFNSYIYSIIIYNNSRDIGQCDRKTHFKNGNFLVDFFSIQLYKHSWKHKLPNHSFKSYKF